MGFTTVSDRAGVAALSQHRLQQQQHQKQHYDSDSHGHGNGNGNGTKMMSSFATKEMTRGWIRQGLIISLALRMDRSKEQRRDCSRSSNSRSSRSSSNSAPSTEPTRHR